MLVLEAGDADHAWLLRGGVAIGAAGGDDAVPFELAALLRANASDDSDPAHCCRQEVQVKSSSAAL